MSRLILMRFCAVCACIAFVACSGNPGRIPDQAQSLAVLDEALRRAREDPGSLCDWEGVVRARCESEFGDSGGQAAVPDELPVVRAHCGFPADKDNAAYRVLQLEGRDGTGMRYQTDFVVTDAGSYGFVPYSPVFWSGVGFTQSGNTGGPHFACPGG